LSRWHRPQRPCFFVVWELLIICLQMSHLYLFAMSPPHFVELIIPINGESRFTIRNRNFNQFPKNHLWMIFQQMRS
jgi:hypothetical protein